VKSFDQTFFSDRGFLSGATPESTPETPIAGTELSRETDTVKVFDAPEVPSNRSSRGGGPQGAHPASRNKAGGAPGCPCRGARRVCPASSAPGSCRTRGSIRSRRLHDPHETRRIRFTE
jgi:hypothetical protein